MYLDEWINLSGALNGPAHNRYNDGFRMSNLHEIFLNFLTQSSGRLTGV